MVLKHLEITPYNQIIRIILLIKKKKKRMKLNSEQSGFPIASPADQHCTKTQ